MLEAYTPYIIKPTKAAGQNPAYTTPCLKKAANQNWLGENESVSYESEENHDIRVARLASQLTITIFKA